VVGANESGKSHLLSAIEKGLTGDNITRRDFCRYSQFFTVEEGSMRWPDFGFEFADLTREDQELLRKVAEIKTPGAIDSFTLIRSDRNTLEIWLPSGDKHSHHPVSRPLDLMGSNLLPKVFHIDSTVALPSSVPLSWLRGTTKRRWPRKDSDLPPFYGPGAVRVGSTATDVSSGRRSAAESARGHISPNSAGVRCPNEL